MKCVSAGKFTAHHIMTLEELFSNFEFLDEWEDRYAYLIDLGRGLAAMDEADKTEENRVKGCQATVWLKDRIEPGSPPVIHFSADSNSAIVKGLISILLLVYSGRTAVEIIQTDARPTFAKLGLDQQLSPTRKIGLHAMMEQIHAIASQCRATQSGS